MKGLQIYFCIVVLYFSTLCLAASESLIDERDEVLEYYTFWKDLAKSVPNLGDAAESYHPDVVRAVENLLSKAMAGTPITVNRVDKVVREPTAFHLKIIVQNERTGDTLRVSGRVSYAHMPDYNVYDVQLESVEEEKWLCDGASKQANCQCNILGHCKKGTAQLDAWLNRTLAMQRQLQLNLPLPQVQLIGSHNAYNDRSDGCGMADNILKKVVQHYMPTWTLQLANQEFALYDVLNMGCRHLELDVHYINKKIRLCHSGGLAGGAGKYVDDAIAFIGKLINRTIEFDMYNLGCSPYARLYEDGLREIAKWLNEPHNKHEVISIYQQDDPHFTWGHDVLINTPLQQIFGSLLLTPQDKDTMWPNRWPTIAEMVQAGKRVVVRSSPYGQHGGKYIFPKIQFDEQVRFLIPYGDTQPLHAWPWCANTTRDMYTRLNNDACVYGPIDLKKSMGVITPTNMHYLTECNIKEIAADMITPHMLNATVYTWEYGTPTTNDRVACVWIGGISGRWTDRVPCVDLHPCVCGRHSSVGGVDMEWMVTSSAHASSECMDVCRDKDVDGGGWAHVSPNNPYDNKLITTYIHTAGAWMSSPL